MLFVMKPGVMVQVFAGWENSEEACGLHKLLPRVLQHMSKNEKPNSEEAAIDELMESVGLQPEMDDSEPNLGWQALLAELLTDKDMTPAELNAKRKRQTFHAFEDPSIPAKAIILDNMIGPNVQLMDMLFRRSKTISCLYHTPRFESNKRAELMERPGSRSFSDRQKYDVLIPALQSQPQPRHYRPIAHRPTRLVGAQTRLFIALLLIASESEP